MLYVGYVGFRPFLSLSPMASLISKAPGDSGFTPPPLDIVTWLFQGTGNHARFRLAYHVLGWGGYWMWDPV